MSLAALIAVAALMGANLQSSYLVEAPDILRIDVTGLEDGQSVRGLHLVRPDGTVNLGAYGEVLVSGSTISSINVAIGVYLKPFVTTGKAFQVKVGVYAYNSQACYVERREPNGSTSVFRFPLTGDTCVLDVLNRDNQLKSLSKDDRITLVRPRKSGAGVSDITFDIDWLGITRNGETRTNYRMQPGDRLVLKERTRK